MISRPKNTDAHEEVFLYEGPAAAAKLLVHLPLLSHLSSVTHSPEKGAISLLKLFGSVGFGRVRATEPP
jgi:hypothetical protein